MTAHAPAAPRTEPRLRAEHVVAAVTATLVIAWICTLFGNRLPRAELVGTTCAWHRSQLVVSGGLMNTGLSDGQFEIDARAWIAGRSHPVRRSASADLSGFSAANWSAPGYGYMRKGLIGNAIVGCAAHVRTIPPPSGED